MKRQLAAILHADVAGYSRLTGLDEEVTHRKLDAGLNLLTEVIAAHGGQKLNEAGDAILAEFNSVTESVTAALAFQSRMSEKNTGFREDERFQFRIGVNLGEVIHDRGDIYGDGVNLAARIQELAEPGGVCITGAVYDQIAGKIDQVFDDLGHRKLKNIAQSVRVYQARFSNLQSRDENRPGFPFITDAKKRPLATGGCLCRSVRFETWDEPVSVGYCHCRFCQLATGAPLNAFVMYKKTAVRFFGDEPRKYNSSPIAKRAFCGNCGTTLFTAHHAPDKSEYFPIRLATMDNPADFPPTMHYGVESQIPWLDINDDLPRIRTDDDAEMQRRWTAVGRSEPKDQLPTSISEVEMDSETKEDSE
jgi:class 3 adenylate cyclase